MLPVLKKFVATKCIVIIVKYHINCGQCSHCGNNPTCRHKHLEFLFGNPVLNAVRMHNCVESFNCNEHKTERGYKRCDPSFVQLGNKFTQNNTCCSCWAMIMSATAKFNSKMVFRTRSAEMVDFSFGLRFSYLRNKIKHESGGLHPHNREKLRV